MQEHKFELVLDGLPYIIKVIPFQYNSEERYKVSYNGGREDIFVWDSSIKRFRALDDDASTMPDVLDIAISEKLLSGIS